MKKAIYVAVILTTVSLLSSCEGALGLGQKPMDKAESYADAIEMAKEKIDTARFKIFSIGFCEGEEVSNDMSYVSVNMVNEDNMAFTQAFFFNGVVSDLSDYRFSNYDIDFNSINGIQLSEIDPEKIVENIDAAKKMAIPEGFTYKAVKSYDISELLPLNTGNNKGRRIGEYEQKFSLCFTEDGKEYETNGGRQTLIYYEDMITITPEGEMKESE